MSDETDASKGGAGASVGAEGGAEGQGGSSDAVKKKGFGGMAAGRAQFKSLVKKNLIAPAKADKDVNGSEVDVTS